MPKVNICFSELNKTFSDRLWGNLRITRKSTDLLAKKSGKEIRTVRRKLNQPESMTVSELRLYVKELNISPREVLKFVYGITDEKSINNMFRANRVDDSD